MDGWNQAEASLILSSKLMNLDQDGIPMNQQTESAKLSAKTPISVLIPVKNEAENLRRSRPDLGRRDLGDRQPVHRRHSRRGRRIWC